MNLLYSGNWLFINFQMNKEFRKHFKMNKIDALTGSRFPVQKKFNLTFRKQ